MEESVAGLREHLPDGAQLLENVSLAPYTTLRVGGPARCLAVVRQLEVFADVMVIAQSLGIPHIILGSGSNILPSDRGLDGLVIINACSRIEVGEEETYAETGCWFQDLFLKAAQAGRAGLEFAVGIPGTLGGALVSNAGAYRASIGDRLTAIEIVRGGERRWVQPSYLEFSYRDSILRRPDAPAIALLAVRLALPPGEPKHIYDLARDYQRQRISKQPAQASAGSFFKNIYDAELALRCERLPDKLKEAGVVPAGFLIEECGLKGAMEGKAQISTRHANFICNMGGATSTEIRRLAERAKHSVQDKFGVTMEEEVMYIGDWDAWE